ncbi:MAG: TIGR03936 family radical SAM-associated protein [Actinomycetota bacterium]|nr:DUF2344 domain-containing protein [Acidothermales bacterium]MDQ3432288.1 TIGR03936 family radical SAM-associated protein [Actinomycetota bacterium]
MGRRPDGPPQPPPVQRLRLRYAKRGRLRFTSHRDFQRALERALRRAQLPVAFSQGFSPHPRISYAGAAPTGVASEAEYVEIALTRRCDLEAVRTALDESLPAGLDVLEVVEANTLDLAARLQASVWLVRLPGVSAAAAAAASLLFLAADAVEVERLTRQGRRHMDARAPVVRIDVLGEAEVDGGSEEDECAILRVVVRHVTPAVRPDDVLTGLRVVADLAPPSPPLVTRLAQGPLDEQAGTVADPLTADRQPTELPTGRLDRG